MHSASIAEWLIGRCVGGPRAAAIVGDLMEARPARGAWWFLLAVVRVLIAVGWRRVAAFVVAFYVGQGAFDAFFMVLSGPDMPLRASQRLWVVTLSVLCGAGMMLWVVGVYATLRYGLRDRLTRLALVLATLVSLGLLYAPEPAKLMACVGFALAVGVGSTCSANYRRAAATVLAATATGFFGGILSMSLEGAYRMYLVAHGMRPGQMSLHPEVKYLAFGLMLLTILTTTLVVSRMHDGFRREAVTDATRGNVA